MPTPSEFAQKLTSIAEDQHERFHLLDEADPVLCKQIKKYWDDLHLGFTSCVTVPWSAVFVSWCVKQAGATAVEFKFAAAHSVFVHQAIQNAINQTGVFRGFDVGAHAPVIGDIIQNNRGGTTHNFAFATTQANYASHSAIVVDVADDNEGPFAVTVGGNEGNSIRRTKVRLTPDKFIKQRLHNPFIAVIANLKQ